MARRAVLQRFDFPIVNKLRSVHFLQTRGFGGVGAPLPIELGHFVRRANDRRRIAIAIETETHAQRFRFAHFVHRVHAPVAFDATDAARDVDGVIEINVVRHVMDLHPRNRRIVCGAVADDLQPRIVFQHDIVAVHARRSAGKIGEPRFFHAVVAIPAIHAELARMNPMRKRHRLDGLITHTRVFGREVNRHACRDASAGERRSDEQQQRQTVCPFRKNHCVFKN